MTRPPLTLLCVVAAGAAVAWHAWAQDVPASSAGSSAASRAVDIVQNGTDAGAPPCQTCHGAQGDGSGSSPRLYGQPATYLVRQLHDFKSPARKSDIMTPVANALTDEQITDVAAYYATTREQPPAAPDADVAVVERGRTLAMVGDNTKRLPACNNCHGPGGTGLPPQIPALSEQFPQYIAAQLQAWRGNTRKNGVVPMGTIAKRLDAHDIEALGAYYAQLRPTTQASAPK